jgi:hypothetical protein
VIKGIASVQKSTSVSIWSSARLAREPSWPISVSMTLATQSALHEGGYHHSTSNYEKPKYKPPVFTWPELFRTSYLANIHQRLIGRSRSLRTETESFSSSPHPMHRGPRAVPMFFRLYIVCTAKLQNLYATLRASSTTSTTDTRLASSVRYFVLLSFVCSHTTIDDPLRQ